MATVSSFKDLRAWQLAIQLATDVYQLTADLPAAEKSDMAANLQQTSVIIPTLIATGHKSGKRSVMRLACLRATEKLNELETLVVISGELHPNVPSNDIIDQLEDVRQALDTILSKLTPPKPAAKSL